MCKKFEIPEMNMGDLFFGYYNPRINVLINLSEKSEGVFEISKLPATLR